MLAVRDNWIICLCTNCLELCWIYCKCLATLNKCFKLEGLRHMKFQVSEIDILTAEAIVTVLETLSRSAKEYQSFLELHQSLQFWTWAAIVFTSNPQAHKLRRLQWKLNNVNIWTNTAQSSTTPVIKQKGANSRYRLPGGLPHRRQRWSQE